MPYIEDINRQYIYSFLHFIITDKTSQQILSPKSLITPLPLEGTEKDAYFWKNE